MGKAYMPSEDLKDFIVRAEAFFNKVHDKKLAEAGDPIKKVADMLKKARPVISGDIMPSSVADPGRFFSDPDPDPDPRIRF